MTEWRGTVEVQYGTVILADQEAAARGLQRARGLPVICGSSTAASLGDGIQVLLPERDDDVPTHVRLLDAPADIEPEWEHVAEVGFRVPTGRLIVFSWMPDEDVAGELTVPTEPQVAPDPLGRARGLADGSVVPVDRRDQVRSGYGSTSCRGSSTVFERSGSGIPGRRRSTSRSDPDGLRIYRGPVQSSAASRSSRSRSGSGAPTRRHRRAPLPRCGGTRVDGSRWADGSGGPWSHKFLQELPPAEADALEAQGFPPLYTYARDTEGRIWAAHQMPLERVPALLLVPADRWTMLQGFMPADQIQVVDLPDGWCSDHAAAARPRRKGGSWSTVPWATATMASTALADGAEIR